MSLCPRAQNGLRGGFVRRVKCFQHQLGKRDLNGRADYCGRARERKRYASRILQPQRNGNTGPIMAISGLRMVVAGDIVSGLAQDFANEVVDDAVC